jgi:hypothetical protein
MMDYLIQLICDELCRHLNAEGRLKATPDDIQKSIDNGFGKAGLFDELWRQQPDAERVWLKKMREGSIVVHTADSALKSLVRLNFVEVVDNRHTIAVPMFAAWIYVNQ